MCLFCGYKAEARIAANDTVGATISAISFNNGNRFVEVGKGFELGIYLGNFNYNRRLLGNGNQDPQYNFDKSLTAVKVNYQVDGGETFTFTPNLGDKGLPVDRFYLAPFKFEQFVKFTDPGKHVIRVWLSDIEGGYPCDSVFYDHSLEVYATEPALKNRHAVLLEEFTGAWCVWCPRGMETVEKLDKKYNIPTPDGKNYEFRFLPTMIHIGDTIMNLNRKDNVGIYSVSGVSGFPSGSIDKQSAFDWALSDGTQNYAPFALSSACVSDGLFQRTVGSRANMKTPVLLKMDHSYNEDTREISFDLEAEFLVDLDGDFRFNAYVIEDKLQNSHSSFDQMIAGALTTVRGSKWEGAENPMTNFEHPHVLRMAAGGHLGFESIIPPSNKKGDKVTHSFTVQLGDDWKAENISLYGFVFVQNGDRFFNREVLDSRGTMLGQPVSRPNPNAITSNVSLVPNPTDAVTMVKYTLKEESSVDIKVMNSVGQVVSKEILGKQSAGNQSYSLDASKLSNGVYFVSITAGNHTYTSKLVVNK